MEASGSSAMRVLLAAVRSCASTEAWDWFAGGLPRSGVPLERAAFLGRYAGVGRRFARPAVLLEANESHRLIAAGIATPERWLLADLARAALLGCAMDAMSPQEHVALVTEVFRTGDNAERIALLRALPLLPGPERFTELAVEACRSHVLDVFAAIACDNPFAAQHFPELSFNQLVMKALFVELPLERVIGWRGRINAELRRVATDYEAERRAAGRPVPAGIALIRATQEPP
jgi:hypothetical protein